MKILHTCKHFYPRITGVTAYVENLAGQQLSQGHEVAVASWGEAAQAQAHPGVHLLRAKAGDAGRLVRLMHEFQPDIIHAHSIWETTHLGVAAARELGRPYVVTTHGTWHSLGHTGAYSRWRDRWRLGVWQRRVVWPRLLRQAGGVVALNALEEADALKAGVSRERLHRIPNAIDAGRFKPADKLLSRQALGWPEGFTILFVGAMQVSKGLFTVLEAARILRHETRLRWIFCGEGPDMDRARAQAESSGVSDRVAFLGKASRETMPLLYQAADAVVLPSHAEAFATALLEAMASGLPCIGSNVGGTPEIIVEGATGYLIPPRDAVALAEKVSTLARDAGLAQAMGQAGRERAIGRFSWPQVAGRIEEVYRRALLPVCLMLLMLLASLPASAVTPLDILTMGLPPDTTEAHKANPIYDGSVIRLRLARGEATAFQILVPASDHASEAPSVPGLQDIALRVRLDTPVTVNMYRLWSIWGVPEVAVPMAPGQPRAFPSYEQQAGPQPPLWRGAVEIEASSQAAAGVLHGELTVQWTGGQASIPLEVTILPFDMPRRPSFVVEMNSYGDYLRLFPATPDMFTYVHRLFQRYRCTFTLVPYRQDGSLLLDFLAPVMTGEDADFTGFDAALGGLFDGSAFSGGQPLSHFLLPLREGWPEPSQPGAPMVNGRNVRVRAAFARHIQEKNWLSTRFQEFHNENPEHGAQVPWRLDEPVTEKDLEGHARFLALLKTACGEWPGNCPLSYRIDISQWRKIVSGLNNLGGVVMDWSVSADPAFLDKGAVDYFRSRGTGWLFAYGELGGFMSGTAPRPWGDFPASLAKYFLLGVDGYAQWQVDCWKIKSLPGVPDWAVPLVYSSASGARDFMWPGTAFGLDVPVPSIRLFAMREGLNILDYIDMAGRAKPEMVPELRRRLRALLGRQPQDWYAFKNELADQLAHGMK